MLCLHREIDVPHVFHFAKKANVLVHSTKFVASGCMNRVVVTMRWFNLLSPNLETTGFNTTIFAYGQTGSGKTFSMQGVGGGSGEGAGIIPRMNEELFAR